MNPNKEADDWFRFASSLARAQISFDAKEPNERYMRDCPNCEDGTNGSCSPICTQPEPDDSDSALAHQVWQENEVMHNKLHLCETCKGRRQV